MIAPLEKVRRSLIHHPSSVLDDLCSYNATNRPWRRFDEQMSHKLLELEFRNRQYIRAIAPRSKRR